MITLHLGSAPRKPPAGSTSMTLWSSFFSASPSSATSPRWTAGSTWCRTSDASGCRPANNATAPDGRHRSAALRATSLLRPQVSCKTLDRRSHPRVWTSMTRSMALLLVWHVIGCDPESRAHRPAPETSVAASVAATTSARPCGSAVPAELVDLFRRCAGATSETCSSHGGQWDPIALDCVCASPDRGCPCTSSHDCVGHCATLKGRDDCETATVGHCTGTLGGCVCVLNDDGSPGELCR